MYNPVLTQDSMRHLLSLAMDASVKLDAPVSPTLPPDIYKYITASIIKQDETVRIMHGSVVSAKPILTLTLAPSCGCGELSAAPRNTESAGWVFFPCRVAWHATRSSISPSMTVLVKTWTL